MVETIALAEQCVAALGERAVAGDMAIVQCFPDIEKLPPSEVRLIKWDSFH